MRRRPVKGGRLIPLHPPETTGSEELTVREATCGEAGSARAELIPIERVCETALGEHVSKATVYRLIREGSLGCVRVGRRVFLTEELVEEFIRGGGAGAAQDSSRRAER